MEQRDLRKWIDQLKQAGLLKVISAEVDWNLELGAITKKVLIEGGPALLFENIKDHKKTWSKRFFTAGIGTRERLALALNLPLDTDYKTMTKVFVDRLSTPIPPIIVKSGPVKENIIKEKEVDLYQFPAPKYHDLDGGRYINTTVGIITQDPDTKELNVGLYRGMIADKNKIGVLLAATQHWGVHFEKYKAKGQPMPVACVYGWDPCLPLVASMPILHSGIKYGEYEHIGSLRQMPVELVKCETIDLMVPSSAEIVFEGFISPNPKDFVMEGPFGEYPGYYGGARSPKPAIEVKCITFRNDPILRGNVEGTSPGRWSENGHWMGSSWGAAAWLTLIRSSVPNIVDVWTPPVTIGTILLVRIKKIYRGHAKQVANSLWGSPVGNYMGKFVVVVDEDIDIHDHEQDDWAISYRVNPAMDQLLTFPGCVGSMLDPSTPLHLRDSTKYGHGKWTRTLIDATKNWELEPEKQYGGDIFPPLATEISPEMQTLINRRWKEYGF